MKSKIKITVVLISLFFLVLSLNQDSFIEAICQTTFLCILGIMLLLIVRKYPPEIQKVFEFLAVAGISLFSLGILFEGIFLTVGAFSAFCIITVWVSYHYRRFTLGMSDSLESCLISTLVTFLIFCGILFLGMGAIILTRSGSVMMPVFCIRISFFVWIVYNYYVKWGFWGWWRFLFKD
jgi:hypothetical protein